MKVCTQCNLGKESEEFPKRKSNKDGLYSWCKECCRKKTKENANKNPEAVKASRDKRREKALEVAREYKKKHKERLDKLKKAHYIINRDEICSKAREYGKNLTEEQKERKRKYYQEWKTTEAAKEYRDKIYPIRKERYKKQQRASKTVTNAIRDGKLERPEKCALCLSEENIEGHHPDYEKPLEVVWLCRKCHRNLHKELKKRENHENYRAK